MIAKLTHEKDEKLIGLYVSPTTNIIDNNPPPNNSPNANQLLR